MLSLFAIPILAGNLLHQAYSVTDSIVVGQCLGQTALAAVGCTAPISMLLAALMIGVTIGVGILISQAYGKRDHEQIRQYLTNGLHLSLMIALFVALVEVPLTVKILHWMGTPAAPLQDAAVYLRINFITAVCPLFYYLLASVMRGIGDSRSALYCLIVSSVANILWDILLWWFFNGALPVQHGLLRLHKRFLPRLPHTSFAANIPMFDLSVTIFDGIQNCL